MKAIDAGMLHKVKEIVTSGLSPNFTTSDSIAFSPLSLAAHKGKYAIVKWLVEQGGCAFDDAFVSFIASSGQIQIADFLARKLLK